MRIVFDVTVDARADLVRLLEPRVSQPLDAVLRAANVIEDVEQQIQVNGRLPAPAVRIVRADGINWWWQYVDGVWLGFQLTESRHLLRSPVRTITLSAAASLPPGP